VEYTKVVPDPTVGPMSVPPAGQTTSAEPWATVLEANGRRVDLIVQSRTVLPPSDSSQ